jgi:hypothetical protein
LCVWHPAHKAALTAWSGCSAVAPNLQLLLCFSIWHRDLFLCTHLARSNFLPLLFQLFMRLKQLYLLEPGGLPVVCCGILLSILCKNLSACSSVMKIHIAVLCCWESCTVHWKQKGVWAKCWVLGWFTFTKLDGADLLSLQQKRMRGWRPCYY